MLPAPILYPPRQYDRDCRAVFPTVQRASIQTLPSPHTPRRATAPPSPIPLPLPHHLPLPPLVHHRFPFVHPPPTPSLLSTVTSTFFTTRTFCLSPITTLWSRFVSPPHPPTPTHPAPSSSSSPSLPPSSSPPLVFPDQWSACPSPLLAWSFAFLSLHDLARCHSVSHAWYALLTQHPLSPLCFASSSLALPPSSPWTPAGLQSLFDSLPYLSALSFARLSTTLSPSPPTPSPATAPTNALQPVPLPSPPTPSPNPSPHLSPLLSLHHLRALLLPYLPLTNSDLFSLSAHLPQLEVLVLHLPSHSDGLSAVGFAHLSVMRRLAHLIVQYEEGEGGGEGGGDGDGDGVREAMIEKQECWLAMMRCKSLRVLNLTRSGRAAQEVEVWQARRKERDEKKRKESQSRPTSTSPTPATGAAADAQHLAAADGAPPASNPSPPASPSHNRRASVPISSSLHALDCRAQTLLSLPSSASFSFSLFFSAFSASLRSFTFSSLASHVTDVPLYAEVEAAVLAALPSFLCLQEVQLNVMSLSLSSLQSLTALAHRLLSFALSRSLLMRTSDRMSPQANSCLQGSVESWGSISPSAFVSFLSSFPHLASLRLQNLPFVTSDSFPSLVAAVPVLHSLHISLIPLSHTALSSLYNLPSLLYLELTIDDIPSTTPPTPRTPSELHTWQQMSARYREWEKRWRLGRVGISEEEEEEARERRRMKEEEEGRRRRWIRRKQMEEGHWDDTLEEEFMNDEEEDEEGEKERESSEAAGRYEGQVLAVWQQLFYLDRLKDGDHHRQAYARARWVERKVAEAEMEVRRRMAEEEEEKVELQVTDLMEGDEEVELDELQLMEEMRQAKATRGMKQSPIVRAAVPATELRNGSAHNVGDGGEDWENVPL